MAGVAREISRRSAGLGALFIVGRLVYLRGYAADPGKRIAGGVITALAQLPLLAGGIIGAVTTWL